MTLQEISPSIPGPQLAQGGSCLAGVGSKEHGWQHGCRHGAWSEPRDSRRQRTGPGWWGTEEHTHRCCWNSLTKFFILQIFSLGCGSMRSHIWRARGPGNFAKLVQHAAQTRRGRQASLRAAGDRPGWRPGAWGRLRWCPGQPPSPPPPPHLLSFVTEVAPHRGGTGDPRTSSQAEARCSPRAATPLAQGLAPGTQARPLLPFQLLGLSCSLSLSLWLVL